MSFWNIFQQKKAPVLEFPVGQGLNPEQTATAYKTIAKPDVPPIKDFWGKAFDFAKDELTPQPIEVRRAFETEPKAFNAPPIVGQLADVGYRLLEALPRAGAILGGEFKAKFQPESVKANIDLRRLGFDAPEYITAAKEQADAINTGENPWISGLRIVSNKTLDLAFGAQLASDLAKLSTKILLSGGSQARIEALDTLQAIQANQKEVFARLKDAPLKEREEALASILNTKKVAQKVLDTEGVPTALDRAKVNASRYTEALSRNTPITKNFWGDIVKPDFKLKDPIKPQAPIEGQKQLPGYRDVPGQAPAFGLSTKAVESVGGEETGKIIIDAKEAESVRNILRKEEGINYATDEQIQEYINKPIDTKEVQQKFKDNVVPEIKKAFTQAQRGVVSHITKKNTDIVISAVDRLIAEGKVRVVSRDHRDVFQIKKGDNWVNARDESSAVKQLTEKYKPKPKVYAAKDQEKLDFAKAQLENVREQLAYHPAKPLLKFIDRKEGQFMDFKNPDLAKNPRRAEQIRVKNKAIMKAAENAFDGHPELYEHFDDPDVIKDVITDYAGQREVEKSLVGIKNNLIKTLKPIQPTAKHISEFMPKTQTVDTTEGEGRSLEIIANQARDILDGGNFPADVSYPKTIEHTVTKVQNKVNIIDTYLRTPLPVMQKIGFGKEAIAMRDAMDAYWKELPQGIDKISKWLKRLKDDKAREAVFDYLDGKPMTLPPREKEVAMEIRKWLEQLGNRLGLPADDRIKYYVTHLFLNETEMAEKEFDEQLAKAIDGKIPKEIYDPFLLKRKGVKGYRRDLGAALDAYWKRAVRKSHIDPVLDVIQYKAGPSLEYANIEKSQFKYIQKYIENINMRPSEAEEGIDNFLKSVIGYKLGQRPTTSILKFLRQATFRGLLGLNPASALRNLSQGINTYATLGEKHTAIGYASLFKLGSGQELAREGVLNAGFVQDRTLSSGKKVLQKMDKVLFSFFETAERINRGAAYFGAKSQYLSKHPKAPEEDAIRYAKSIVRKTQFSFDSVDTPVGMANDIAKTLFQFQTYTTKQIEFLGGMAKDSFKSKDKKERIRNFAGLVRYALAGMAFTYTIGKAFGMDPSQLLPWYRFDTPPSLKAPAEIAGAVLDTPDKYGNKRTVKQKLKDIGKTLINLIPAGAQAKKTIEGLDAVKKGGSYTSNGKLQFKQGDSKAEILQSILFGKYASANAKGYFNGDKVSVQEFERLSKLPPEEANAIVKGYKESNPTLYNAIKKLKQDKKLGITEEDQNIRDMGVQNKERATYILDQALKFKTKEERNAYIKSLIQKKIATPEVIKQIKALMSARKLSKG